jgi:penicillin-binding protein 2
MKKAVNKKFNSGKNPFTMHGNGSANAKLSAGYRLRWTEEGMLGEREAETAGEKIGRNIAYQKINWLIIIIAAGFLLLFARAAYLQAFQGEYYGELAQYNRLRRDRVSADRGVIYDSKKKILADNAPVFYLQFIPSQAVAGETEGYNFTVTTKIIGNILGKETEEALDYLFLNYQHKPIEANQPQVAAEKINYEQAIRLMTQKKEMPGISVGIRAQRQYQTAALSLSHVLGYTGIISAEEYERAGNKYALSDYTGKLGLEKFWENELAGEPGEKYVEVDALGKEKRVISEKPKQDGNSLLLAIDGNLQKKIETELAAQLDKIDAKKAAAVAINPNNGEVLALVNLPSFDSNDFAFKISPENYQQLLNDPSEPLFNKAVSGAFPIGSTFKPIVAAAALQENIATANTTVNSAGGLQIKSWFFPDWKAGGHGITNMRKALAWSVNTYFYYVGGGYDDFQGLGVQKITDYARLFGLGEKLGIDLPSEASGFLPSKEWKEEAKKEMWYIGDTYHLAIGQGDITASPLQVAAYTSVFANGGTLYQPHIVKELLNSRGETTKMIEPKILRHDFIEQKNIELVRQGMRDCVIYGSCRSLDGLPVPAAGKTGTAQWSEGKKAHSWFTGFAPFDNPEIVITVIVEEGGEATDAAVPVAKRVLE